MNKVKATKSEMKENYYIISAGYCSIQNLLRYENPIAYSSGIYGWSCDYYDIDNVVISTGYSPINSKRTNLSYETIKAYEEKASHIINETKFKWETKKRKVKELLSKMIKESKEV